MDFENPLFSDMHYPKVIPSLASNGPLDIELPQKGILSTNNGWTDRHRAQQYVAFTKKEKLLKTVIHSCTNVQTLRCLQDYYILASLLFNI